jgi:hypothetical protein
VAMLNSGTDITGIALWLGHESPETTHIYDEADLKTKEQALQERGSCRKELPPIPGERLRATNYGPSSTPSDHAESSRSPACASVPFVVPTRGYDAALMELDSPAVLVTV